LGKKYNGSVELCSIMCMSYVTEQLMPLLVHTTSTLRQINMKKTYSSAD